MTDKGLTLPCPLCGEESAVILLNLSDMNTCHCEECAADFDLDAIKAIVKQWAPVLAWIEQAPTA